MLSLSELLRAKILIVDDLAANVQLLAGTLAVAGYVSVSTTMDPTAVRELHRQHRYDLILLDLQMPVMDGFQVIEAVKEIDPDDYLPIIVITAQPGHKLRALRAGAKDFISKPFDLAEVLARVHNMLEVRLLHKQLHAYTETLEARVKVRTADLHASHLETIFTMTRAAEYKDSDTGAHVRRISYYSRALATILGMDEAFSELIYFASPMHDIGKIGVQDQVLLKPGELTAEEWQIMKSHTSMGAKILANSRSPYLQMGAEIALNHHERWDGSGYPNGEWGETIPLSARIMNIGDIYDALRSRRPYKPALDHAVAVDIITRGDRRTRPQHFDPAVLSAFAQHPQIFRDIFETYTAKTEPGREAAMACENPIPSGKRIFQHDGVQAIGTGRDDGQRAA